MRRRAIVRSGFSLLELMLVLVIIGVLASVAAWQVVAQGEKAKRKATFVSMETISQALDSYQLDKNTLPPDLATLGKQDLDPRKLKDGWGRDFYFSAPGAGGAPYELISAGKDGQFGTEDDADWSKRDTENK